MSSASAIALGAVLAVVFLVLIGVMLFQEIRTRPSRDPAEFIIDDAVNWVWSRLDGGPKARLTPDGVRSILEWQVFGLQQSVKGKPPGSASVVMGATDESVDYILTKLDSLDPEDVRAVLAGQFGYLESIGAIAGVAEGNET
jgi:hypothetical protein